MSEFDNIERALGYVFKDKGLLKRALTLSSCGGGENNESLECLGDALLTFLVAEKYYGEGLSESEITLKKQQYLSDEALRSVSTGLGLDGALIKDKGDTGNKKAVPSAYEAVCAAVYLDGGMQAAKECVFATLKPAELLRNYVGELKELLEKRGKSLPKPEKRDLGTPQSHLWEVTLTIDGLRFTGLDLSSKAAERLAARQALEYFEKSVRT